MWRDCLVAYGSQVFAWGDMGRYGEMWGDVGRCGAMWGDVGRCGEVWGDVGRCGEIYGEICGDIRGDMRRYGRWGEMNRCGELWGDVGRCTFSCAWIISTERRENQKLSRESVISWYARSILVWGDMGRYGEIWGVCALQAVHPLGAPPHPRPFLATSSTRPRHFLDTPQVVHHTDVIPRASLRNLLLLSSLEAERRILVTPVLPVVCIPSLFTRCRIPALTLVYHHVVSRGSWTLPHHPRG